MNPRKNDPLLLNFRNQVEQSIRGFFLGDAFIEIRTPLLVPSPGFEPHIRPIRASAKSTQNTYLPTSPELAMKKVLGAGYERIFQICPAFRDEPQSSTHLPEFTILEWYRANAGYEKIMEDVEKLFQKISHDLFGELSFSFAGQTIHLESPWERKTVSSLFREFAEIELSTPTLSPSSLDCATLLKHCERLGISVPEKSKSYWDDLFYLIWLNQIEPSLPKDRPLVVYEYPPSQAALSNLIQSSEGNWVSKRFEVFVGGIELGNAFDEVVDPEENEKRFLSEMKVRERVYEGEFLETPRDDSFFQALKKGIPPSGGIAMGVDRMVMLFADEPDIRKTIAVSEY